MPIENMSRDEIIQELGRHATLEVCFNWIPNQTTQLLAALLQFHRYGGLHGKAPQTILSESQKITVVSA